MTKTVDIKDACPEWADQLIHQLVALEVQLGNITKEDDWTNKQMETLMNQAFDKLTENSRIEEEVDSLFQQICQRLGNENFTTDQVANFINARAVSKTSKLAYCSSDEVNEAF